MCHMSPVTCHMSRVTCHIFLFFYTTFFFNGGASWLRVCYQQGLPRLVLCLNKHMYRQGQHIITEEKKFTRFSPIL